IPPPSSVAPLRLPGALRRAAAIAERSAASRATTMEGAFRSGAPWPVALRTRRCQSISPPASARAVKGTSTNKASITQRATETLLRASGMCCLALLLHQRLDRLADALAQDEHLADVGRRLLLVAVVQVEQVRDAAAVQDGHDQRRERHLLAQLR